MSIRIGLRRRAANVALAQVLRLLSVMALLVGSLVAHQSPRPTDLPTSSHPKRALPFSRRVAPCCTPS
jgi:hypothetical protein